MTDQRPFGGFFYQRYHHRCTPESLAYASAQCLEASIMVYHLTVAHGYVLTLVLGFQLSVSLMIDLIFLRDFTAIQFPQVAFDSFDEYFVRAGLLFQSGFLYAFVQFRFNGYSRHTFYPFLQART